VSEPQKMPARPRTAPSAGARKALRVLLVEDCADDADLLGLELRRGGYDPDLLRVQTAAEMAAALQGRVWDIVISDHSLPSFSAPAAFALMRETGLDLPFIIVSGTVGEDVAVEAMRTGVHDYILKGNLRRLTAAIERELREAAMRAEQRRIREQLLISERMASVGTLAAGVAHEINNPLSVVIGNLDCLAADVAEVTALVKALGAGGRGAAPSADVTARLGAAVERLGEPLADAREASDRVRLIVRDLRLFSRADEEVRGPVDIRHVLESSIRMARNEIKHRARLVRAYRDVPEVHANEARLSQVFLNLLVNAAQAIPEGQTDAHAITVSTQVAGDRVEIAIADTGAGIAADVLPRIFDVFFTTKPIGVGTGLGLAICHRIVGAMGGDITVDSKGGVGTTFRVSLPRARAGGTAELPVVKPAAATTRRAAVLVVEDEQTVGRMLQRLLGTVHDVTLVGNGREALQRLAAGKRFDVILCDLMMPEMTGMDFHAELERTASDMAARVVFVTGGAFTPRAREFLDRVDNPRLDKPVDVARLREVIDQIAEGPARARVSARGEY
jgi:signal transduction histidine kinase